jgi:uncharacterized membrane protein YkoI
MKLLNALSHQILVALFAVQALIFTSPSIAAEDISPQQARKLIEAGEIMQFEKIAEIALSIKPGRILESELERSRRTGMYIYDIEILDDKGVVWELNLNAKTGELIKLKIDD